MKHYSKSQYGKQFFQANMKYPEPGAPPTQVPSHPPDAPRVYSEMFVSIQMKTCLGAEALAVGLWESLLEPRF